jgi:hypothetical protein
LRILVFWRVLGRCVIAPRRSNIAYLHRPWCAGRWPDLNAVVVVESRRELNGKITDETRFYIAPRWGLPAAAVGPMIRARWAIENPLHWVMDMVFRDDECPDFETAGTSLTISSARLRAKISSASGAKPPGRNDEYLANLIAAKIICIIDEQARDQASRGSDQP